MNTADMIEHGGHAAALAWHLQYNHYPPVPLRMVPTCRAAIAAAAAGDWDTLAALPDGVTYQGRNTAPVWAIIEAHHLAPFVEDAEVTPEPAPNPAHVCDTCGTETPAIWWHYHATGDGTPDEGRKYCGPCWDNLPADEVDE